MTNIGNIPNVSYNNVLQTNINGKPYITVSSKGITNGLSTIPNDGADFGPDTSLGATSPNQIGGSTLTQTNGIQEATTYAQNQAYALGNGGLTAKIYLGTGNFYLNQSVNVNIVNGNNKVIYIGNGWERTTILASSSFSPTTDYLFTFGNNYSEDIWFEDIAFSNGNNATGSIAGVINHQYASPYYSNVLFRHCYFETNLGLIFNGIYGGRMVFDNCYFDPSLWYRIIQITNSTLSITFSKCFLTPYLTSGLALVIGAGSTTTSGTYNCRSIVFDTCNITLNSSGSRVVYVPEYATVDLLSFRDCTVLTSGSVNTTAGSYAGILVNNDGIINTLVMDGVRFNYTTLTNPINNTGTINYFKPKNITNHAGNQYLSLVIPTTSPTLSANPPVSGTVYQNTNPYDIEIDLPAYATTSGTAGYVTLAKGTTSTPASIGNQFVNGATSSTSTEIIKLEVPAGWYYSFTTSGVTLGTATVFAK